MSMSREQELIIVRGWQPECKSIHHSQGKGRKRKKCFWVIFRIHRKEYPVREETDWKWLIYENTWIKKFQWHRTNVSVGRKSHRIIIHILSVHTTSREVHLLAKVHQTVACSLVIHVWYQWNRKFSRTSL